MKKTLRSTIPVLLILFFVGFSSCSRNKNESQEVFIISELTKLGDEQFTLPDCNFPDGGSEYYQEYNFILDSAGHLFYFYRKPGEWGFMPGPVFANLNPNELVQIPQNSIIEFLKINVLEKKYHHGILISSQKDTIRSEEFSDLYHFLCDSTKDIGFCVRTSTAEEDIVLLYKSRKCNYVPENILWDSTKTIFYLPPTVSID